MPPTLIRSPHARPAGKTGSHGRHRHVARRSGGVRRAGRPGRCRPRRRPGRPGRRGGAYAAAVLLARPDILLLDEPTNDLDDDGLARLAAYSGTLVLVTHDRRLAEAVAVDRVLDVRDLAS
jgi:hypothetical protein